jgi:hypothetical protein
MSDLLEDAGRAAGVDPASVEVMREFLRNANAYVAIDFRGQWKREAEQAKADAKAAGDALPDYAGTIARCQARADISSGRVTESSRCQRKPSKVRRCRDDHGVYRGDGRLAVCIQHARTVGAPDRWVKTDHWMDRGRPPTASEVVEPEYQP